MFDADVGPRSSNLVSSRAYMDWSPLNSLLSF